MNHTLLLYSLSAFAYVAACLITAAFRWFHLCKPYDRHPEYYYPARPMMTLLMMAGLFLLPYVWNPADADSWILLKIYMLVMCPYICGLSVYRYFNDKNYHRHRHSIIILSSLPLALMAVLIVLAVKPGTDINCGFCKNSLILTSTALGAAFTAACMTTLHKLHLRIKETYSDDYSNESDFPVQFARNVIWLPLFYMLPAWILVFTDSRCFAAVVTFCFAIINTAFIISILNPHYCLNKKDDYPCEPEPAECTEDESPAEEPDCQIAKETVDRIKLEIQHIVIEEQRFLDPHLSMKAVADECSFGRTYVSTVFKTQLGGFFDYINRQRLTFADDYKRRNPQATQDEIAAASGFGSRTSYLNMRKKLNLL
jgi:AraC-like DNA-binding protein